jgi:hypothetical protein
MTPTPLVLQIHHVATDSRNDITELLRQALVVRTHLGLAAFRELTWKLTTVGRPQPRQKAEKAA